MVCTERARGRSHMLLSGYLDAGRVPTGFGSVQLPDAADAHATEDRSYTCGVLGEEWNCSVQMEQRAMLMSAGMGSTKTSVAMGHYGWKSPFEVRNSSPHATADRRSPASSEGRKMLNTVPR